MELLSDIAWSAPRDSLAPLTLEGLFRQHASDVHRIVRRLLGPAAPAADVDDLTQQVFIAVHRALPKFRHDSAVTTWLYGIAARVVLHHLRGWRRYRAMIERFEASTVFDHAPPDLEETAAHRQALHRVWSVLIRLKPDKRVVVVLHDIEGWSLPEIAAALQLKEEAVRSRLRRARAELHTSIPYAERAS